jgi:hypothetical protein
LSPFQIANNQISRDVKGLFLGDRFVSKSSLCYELQLEDALHV